jgi:Kef-type K+ transport system membrane component KefB
VHDEKMQLLLQVTAAWLIIVAAAYLCGRLARLVRQPAVLGEMVAGVALGPSLLGFIAPRVGETIFTPDVKPVLYVIAMIGLSAYMFLVGVDHHHQPASRSAAATPLVLGIFGVLVPLLLGSLAFLPLSESFRPAGVDPAVFVLFVAGSLAVTAFPMLARILEERRMSRTNFGGVVTRAAAFDDVLAWLLLAVITAIHVNGSALRSLHTVVPAIIFVVACFWLLPKLFRKPMEDAVSTRRIGDGLFVGILVLVLLAGWYTDYIGVYSVFGGFVAGMALPRTPGFSKLLNERMSQIVRCLFLPVFFAYSGLNTNFITAFDGASLGALFVLTLVAFGAKALASVGVLRAFKWPWGQTIAMSGLLNARGLMILIYINIGLSLGIIETRLFSVLVLLAIVTTMVAVPIYRAHFTDEREEEERESSQNVSFFGASRDFSVEQQK